MSNDFLRSSPSRDVIDPLIYQSLAESELRSTTSTKPSKGKNSKKNHKKNQQQQQQMHPQSSVPPSASKSFNPVNAISSGWTPLISKTYFNEQILSFNSTPNKYLLSNLNNTNNNNPNNNNNLLNTNQLNQDYLDFTSGLNLTPFLNHNNLNILQQTSSSSINQQLNNITPFHEKTLHLTDFFMDSPIRQTPLKDLDTITPSRFKLNYSDKKPSLSGNNKFDPKSAQKRSITQIDTPPRQPHKLSITTKANDDSNKENNNESLRNESDDEDDYDEDQDELLQKTRFFLQTPSKKVLSNITNFSKTPIKHDIDREILTKFQTPAKQIPSSPSSPSTVIMSSAVKPGVDNTNTEPNDNSNDDHIQDEEDSNETTDEEDNDNDNDNLNQPPSPTPKKDGKQLREEASIPVMGVFSEKKTKPIPSNKASLTANYSKGSRISSNDSFDSDKGKGTGGLKGNRSKMQAGMNKFQIIFTDVHTLMNNRKKKSSNEQQSSSNSSGSKHKSSTTPNLPRKQLQPPPQQQQSQEVQLLKPNYNSNHHHNHQQSLSDHNISINTSKEISIMSGVGNTSHLNLTSGTDQSMELGGITTTPNGKFFLDKVFDKNSPQTQNLLNSTYYMIQQQQQQHQQQLQQHNISMPPPTNAKQQQQLYQQQMVHPSQYNLQPQQQSQQPQHPIMMMMSTPQHQNVINYANYGSDNLSPDDDSTGNFINFPKDTSSASSSQPTSSSSAPSSQGYMLGMSQSMMMPTMMNMKNNNDGK
ncbi:hypothetical protein DFJ63DRAFT_311354 [Scheffersomyces coipomensis]|uniref:uncharacterized protein n=1 Tax=Scheffersomyces coipomensis TaxID=1788519 RepID=UPI00315DF341